MPDASTSTATTNFDKTVQELIVAKLEELLRAPLPHLLPDNFEHVMFVPGTNATGRFLNIPDLAVDATEADRKALYSALGLDKPYVEQFYIFITEAIRGDFGISIRERTLIERAGII